MKQSEVELAILKKYAEQYDHVGEAAPKCDRELDMRTVLKEIVGDSQSLERDGRRWLDRLAPRTPGRTVGVLRPCSDGNVLNSTHKFHARAFTDPINNQPSPAWDRISELEERLAASQNDEKGKEVLQLNPNFHGVSIDLKEAWKRIKHWFAK